MDPEGEDRRKTDRRREDRRKGERRKGDRRRLWQRERAQNTVSAWQALKEERQSGRKRGGLFRRRARS
jgi:hypothetical protein